MPKSMASHTEVSEPKKECQFRVRIPLWIWFEMQSAGSGEIRGCNIEIEKGYVTITALHEPEE